MYLLLGQKEVRSLRFLHPGANLFHTQLRSWCFFLLKRISDLFVSLELVFPETIPESHTLKGS